MSIGEFVGELLRRLAVVLGVSVVRVAVEEGASGLALRYPGALRFTRRVGGALLVLSGLLWVVTDIVMAIYVLLDRSVVSVELQGASDAAIVIVVWLVDLGMALGCVVLGLRIMRRGGLLVVLRRPRASSAPIEPTTTHSARAATSPPTKTASGSRS